MRGGDAAGNTRKLRIVKSNGAVGSCWRVVTVSGDELILICGSDMVGHGLMILKVLVVGRGIKVVEQLDVCSYYRKDNGGIITGLSKFLDFQFIRNRV